MTNPKTRRSPRPAALWALALTLSSVALATEPPNLDAAIEAQRLLVAESPTGETLNDLANLLVLDGRPEEAESLYRRVLASTPSDVRAAFNLGLLLQSRSQLDEAEQLFRSVVERHPRHAWSHYQLGSLHEARDARGEAIQAYARAFALDPNLYFADVNPQVVSNRLLTESLLVAASLRQTRSTAPMEYAQPRDITQMLLGLPTPEEPLESER